MRCSFTRLAVIGKMETLTSSCREWTKTWDRWWRIGNCFTPCLHTSEPLAYFHSFHF